MGNFQLLWVINFISHFLCESIQLLIQCGKVPERSGSDYPIYKMWTEYKLMIVNRLVHSPLYFIR